jgi:ubiquitin-protein ligase E3 C
MTLDELASFSHQLMNITFPLYWHEDLIDMKEGNVPGMRFRWEAVRDRLTRCLQALHMREYGFSFFASTFFAYFLRS